MIDALKRTRPMVITSNNTFSIVCKGGSTVMAECMFFCLSCLFCTAIRMACPTAIKRTLYAQMLKSIWIEMGMLKSVSGVNELPKTSDDAMAIAAIG